jgi:hypothetical protein
MVRLPVGPTLSLGLVRLVVGVAGVDAAEVAVGEHVLMVTESSRLNRRGAGLQSIAGI